MPKKNSETQSPPELSTQVARAVRDFNASFRPMSEVRVEDSGPAPDAHRDRGTVVFSTSEPFDS